MSFAELKKARSARQAVYTTPRATGPVSSGPFASASTSSSSTDVHDESVTDTTPASSIPELDSELYTLPEGLYSALSDSDVLEARTSKIGRGLYIKSSRKEVIKPGTTLLDVQPIVSALSTSCLSSYCSYCHSEGSSSATAMNANASGWSATKSLKRCTLCKVVWYDTTDCQTKDWPTHKLECAALRKWSESAKQAKADAGGDVTAGGDATFVPNDAVRALGRILFTSQLLGTSSVPAREIQAMQSLRTSLKSDSPAQSLLTNLGQSLARYIDLQSNPAALSRAGISSAAELVDLLSKFATNSFTLTTPSLTPIGVCVSPLVALVNHSCAPNAVVVVPRPGATAPSALKVIALREIRPGEQIFNSYVDITLPGEQRQRELKETYFFDCNCSACSDTSVDPRTAFRCRKCSTLRAFPADDAKATTNGGAIRCSECDEMLVSNVGEFQDAVRVGKQAYEKASKLQFGDPQSALKYTSTSLALLSGLPLHPSSDPYLALTRLHLSLLIDAFSSSILASEPSSIEELRTRDAAIDESCRFGARCITGVSAILPLGHPIRGIALAELGKLLCVDVDSSSSSNSASGPTPAAIAPGSLTAVEAPLPRGATRLQLAAQILIRAREELRIGFGRNGGEVGEQVAEMLKSLERESRVWGKLVSEGMSFPELATL